MKQNWINITDKLPPAEIDVLVSDGIGIYISNRLDDDELVWDESHYDIIEITHWMFLPELPNENNTGLEMSFSATFAKEYDRAKNDIFEKIASKTYDKYNEQKQFTIGEIEHSELTEAQTNQIIQRATGIIEKITKTK
jgi:hypothetical protein